MSDLHEPLSSFDEKAQQLYNRKEEINALKKDLQRKVEEFDSEFKKFVEMNFNLKTDQEFHLVDLIVGARRKA